MFLLRGAFETFSLPAKNKQQLKIHSCSASGSTYVTWKIPRFSSRFQTDEKLLSSPFSYCDAQWVLGLLVSNVTEDNTVETVKFCLFRISSHVRVHHVSFKIGMENQTGAFENIYQYGTEFEEVDTAWRSLISFIREELLTRYTRNDVLTIFFDMRASYSKENTDERLNRGLPDSTKTENASTSRENLQGQNGINILCHDYEVLLSNKENCDVTLAVGNEKIPAHKLILGARSSVFDAMFEHEMLEKRTNVATILDIQPLTFKDVLYYIYTGRVRNFSFDKAIDLYKVADIYDLKELKAQCVKKMLAGLTLKNACQLAKVADTYNDGTIEDSVLRLVGKNPSDFLASKEWDDLLKENEVLAKKIMKSVTSQLAPKR